MRGQVTDETGASLADAKVEILRRDPPVDEGAPAIHESVITDSEGRFLVTDLPVGDCAVGDCAVGDYAVLVHRTTYLPELRPRVTVGTGSSTALDVGHVVLEKAAALRLRLVDGDGEPIAGAEARLDPPSLPNLEEPLEQRLAAVYAASERSDDRGRVTFFGRSGDTRALRLTHPDFAPQRVRVLFQPDEVEIELQPGLTLTGRLLDSSGRPVSGAQATLSASRAQQEIATKTDEQGRFRFDHVRRSEVQVRVRSNGFPTFRQRLGLSSGEAPEPLDVRLPRTGRIDVTVFDEAGLPLPGADVLGYPEESDFTATGGKSDPEGRVELVLPLGKTRVLVRSAGRFDYSKSFYLYEDTELEVLTALRPRIAVRLVDPDGAALKAASAHLRGPLDGGPDTAEETFYDRGSGHRLVFYPDSPGTYALTTSVDGYRDSVETVCFTGSVAPVQTVEMRPGRRIAGWVRGLETEDLGRLEIQARGRGPGGTKLGLKQGEVDAEGRFRVEGLEPGRWTLTAYFWLADKPRVVRDVLIPKTAEGGETTHVDLVFLESRPAGARVGRLTHNGEPMAHKSLQLVEPERTFRTDGLGRFALDGVEPGTWTARIFGPWGTAVRTLELTGLEDELNLDIQTHRVQGRILGPDGEPLAGAHLSWLPAVSDDHPAAQPRPLAPPEATAADGRFDLPAVLPGPGRWLVEHDELGALGRHLDLDRGLEDLTFRYAVNPPVRFVLTPPDVKTPSSVNVAVSSAGRRWRFELEPTADGSFETRKIPAGPHRVTLHLGSASSRPFDLDPAAGPDGLVVEPELVPHSTLFLQVPELRFAAVDLVDERGDPFSARDFGYGMDAWVLLNGELAVYNLPVGTWKVRVRTHEMSLEAETRTRATEATHLALSVPESGAE